MSGKFLLHTVLLALALPPLHAQQPTTKPLLDVMRISAEGDATAALVTPKAGPARDVQCDIVIIGGGLGGVSAALAAVNNHDTVCLTEPTLWVGGQATSQGVSAFDDNKYIDTTGGTASYLSFSRRIREFYAQSRRDKSLTTAQAIAGPIANPGSCWVGRLCFEPAPAEKILMQMLQPSLDNKHLKLWTHTAPVAVDRDGLKLRSVLAYDFAHQQWLRLHGKYFVEATELGDLIALSGLPYRVGAEAQSETHERNAPAVAQPHASQSFTYPFVLAADQSTASHSVSKPTAYESFLSQYTMVVDYGHGKLLTYGFYEARPGLPGSFWVYRRSVDASKFTPADYPTDRAMINWSSNDHCDSNLLSGDATLEAHALQDAKRQSLGFAWWIENSVPRDDHTGMGYADLKILPAEMGSSDGLSQFPYIRESRRIIPLRTIVEEDLAVDFQPGSRAQLYPDTVGIGWYPIDIHSCERQDFVSASKPYEIPLGALIARDADNLLAVGKTIGTTHITNGAYRLHPTEWADGEAVGATLSFSLAHHTTPQQIESTPAQLQQLQLTLAQLGHPIFWYDDVNVGSENFAAMQMAGARGWLPLGSNTLHGAPDAAVTPNDVVKAIAADNISVDVTFAASLRAKNQVAWEDLKPLGFAIGSRSGVIHRGEFAAWLLQQIPQK